MDCLEKMRKGEDFIKKLQSVWGPPTECGFPVELNITAELSHKEGRQGYCLSMIGSLVIKKCDKLGLVPVNAGWQCTDMDKYLSACGLYSPILDRILEIWRKWNLNDMKAGTEAQDKCLKKLYEERGDGAGYVDYYERCEYLKKHGLLDDPLVVVDGSPYRYGSRWLFRKIPDEVLCDLCRCLDRGIVIMRSKEEK